MLKIWLKKFVIISFELLLICGVLWFALQKKGIQSPSQIIPALEQTASDVQSATSVQQKPLPAAEQPIQKTFSWQYKSVNYSLNLTLNKSIYDYYSSEPKTYAYFGTLPANWENDYYGMFLKQNSQDQTIVQLAASLQQLGQRHDLTADQIVDLTLAFVQSIPYDDARAKEILSKTGDTQMQYPYETLYRQLGVCSDKSLLATALLRQMGYGVALFAYEQDNHMAIGIQCPKNYSTYGSGYCYAETTAIGNKIGIIPSFDSSSNKTLTADQLSSSVQNQQIKLQQLGQVSIFQQTTGKEYDGIIETNKIMQEVDQLKSSINSQLLNLQSQQKSIKQEQSQLNDMQNTLNGYKNQQNIDQFNSLVPTYNNLLQNYQKDVKKYNNNVALYNQTIERYNTLIKQ